MTWQKVPIAHTSCIYREKYHPTIWYNNRQHVKIYLTSYCMQLLTFQCETAALCFYAFALQWGNVATVKVLATKSRYCSQYLVEQYLKETVNLVSQKFINATPG